MKRSMVSLLALLAIGTVAVSGVSALPWMARNMTNSDVQQALENNDYEGFKAAVSNEINNSITEDMFNRMAEKYQYSEAIKNALDNGDYQAWKSAVEAATPPSITDLITQDNFADYVAMYHAIQDGDMNTTRELAQKLGIGPGMGVFGGGYMEADCPMGGMGDHYRGQFRMRIAQ